MFEKVLSRTRSKEGRSSTDGGATDSSAAEGVDASPYAPARTSQEKKRTHVAQGRGGAGNITDHPSPLLSPADLATPTLKGDFFTTGRGGTGNMAKNTDADEARRAQDVVPLVRHETNTNVRIGRGGAANVAQISPEEIEKDKRVAEGKAREKAGEVSATKADTKVETREEKPQVSLADKGKNWLLGLAGKGNKPSAA